MNKYNVNVFLMIKNIIKDKIIKIEKYLPERNQRITLIKYDKRAGTYIDAYESHLKRNIKGEVIRYGKKLNGIIGDALQRRNLRYRRWNLGILPAIKNFKLNIIQHTLTPHCTDPLDHSSCIVIKKDGEALEKTEVITNANDSFACPKCKKLLSTINNFYYCKTDSLAFPIIQGIPILTIENSIISSRLSDLIEE